MTRSRAPLRVAVAQIDTTVGDFPGNVAKILEFGRRAEDAGADLVLFPELAVCGYSPRDLVERASFVAATEKAADRIARASGKATWIYGALAANRGASGRRVFNVAVVARGGRRVATYRKRLLPTYDVFDEGRYFEPGDRPLVLKLGGRRVAVTICEDIWNDKTFWKRPLYDPDPVAELKPLGLDLHVNISASPYTLGKNRLRRRMMERIARTSGVPLVHCNLVGGNDDLVFDGSSVAFDARGRLVGAARRFEEDFWTIDVPGGRGPAAAPSSRPSRACAGRSCSRSRTTPPSAASGAPSSASRAASTRPSRRRWPSKRSAPNASSASPCRDRTRRREACTMPGRWPSASASPAR